MARVVHVTSKDASLTMKKGVERQRDDSRFDRPISITSADEEMLLQGPSMLDNFAAFWTVRVSRDLQQDLHQCTGHKAGLAALSACSPGFVPRLCSIPRALFKSIISYGAVVWLTNLEIPSRSVEVRQHSNDSVATVPRFKTQLLLYWGSQTDPNRACPP